MSPNWTRTFALLYRIDHLTDFAVIPALQLTSIANLATHFGIKW